MGERQKRRVGSPPHDPDKITQTVSMYYFILFNKMVYSVLTQHQYISFGYMFRYLQNHLQANVNYRVVHSMCTYTVLGQC